MITNVGGADSASRKNAIPEESEVESAQAIGGACVTGFKVSDEQPVKCKESLEQYLNSTNLVLTRITNEIGIQKPQVMECELTTSWLDDDPETNYRKYEIKAHQANGDVSYQSHGRLDLKVNDPDTTLKFYTLDAHDETIAKQAFHIAEVLHSNPKVSLTADNKMLLKSSLNDTELTFEKDYKPYTKEQLSTLSSKKPIVLDEEKIKLLVAHSWYVKEVDGERPSKLGEFSLKFDSVNSIGLNNKKASLSNYFYFKGGREAKSLEIKENGTECSYLTLPRAADIRTNSLSEKDLNLHDIVNGFLRNFEVVHLDDNELILKQCEGGNIVTSLSFPDRIEPEHPAPETEDEASSGASSSPKFPAVPSSPPPAYGSISWTVTEREGRTDVDVPKTAETPSPSSPPQNPPPPPPPPPIPSHGFNVRASNRMSAEDGERISGWQVKQKYYDTGRYIICRKNQ